jgi:divalent metal cation (Fe/Co/Zn/Cd) transporter
MKFQGPRNGFSVIILFILGILIFYQAIITLILPFRFNIFILLIEIALFFFFMLRIIWPY